MYTNFSRSDPPPIHSPQNCAGQKYQRSLVLYGGRLPQLKQPVQVILGRPSWKCDHVFNGRATTDVDLQGFDMLATSPTRQLNHRIIVYPRQGHQAILQDPISLYRVPQFQKYTPAGGPHGRVALSGARAHGGTRHRVYTRSPNEAGREVHQHHQQVNRLKYLFQV